MNSSAIKVSVIIPVYNTEKYLPECLESVLNQTLKDIEIICVDDCSPDRCGEILDEYAACDNRVKPIHLPENRRQGYARNRAMERATGEFLYFLDSDDLIDPETLEELTQLAERDNLDAVFFDKKGLHESEEMKKIYAPLFSLRSGKYPDAVITGEELLDAFIRQREWTSYPQQIFWRRDFIRKNEIQYLEGSEHEDEFFAYAGVLLSKRVRYIRKQYFTLRIRPNSVMTSPKEPKNFHGYLMNFYHMNEFLAKHHFSSYGAEFNITSMFDCAMQIYKTLGDVDFSAPFVRELDKKIYRYFMTFIRLEYSETGCYWINPEGLKEIQKYRIAYIYGIAPPAPRVSKKLARHGVLIGGFLTDKPEEAPKAFLGWSVQGIDEANIPDDAIVVVADSDDESWQKSCDMLMKRNINCLLVRCL